MKRSTWIAMSAVVAAGMLAGCGDDTDTAPMTTTTTTTGTTTSSSSSSSGTGGSSPDCGDGDVTPPEECDDGNATAGDGCGADCSEEDGFDCTGAPSVCTTTCGDGVTAGDEDCDDGNTASGDGCDATCVTETAACGNGVIDGSDACDDGNVVAGDGCDAACAVEAGFDCVGEPSACTAICGDGLIVGAEECDDGGVSADDGCGPACAVENGFVCVGEPSVCNTSCGDGIIAGLEECDDANMASGDGCDGVGCAVEPGYECVNIPSVCNGICGDGVIIGDEQCDDGNTNPGDGCGAACSFEGMCGDGSVGPGEQCDDGNMTDGDGCGMTCQLEAGTVCGDAIDLNTAGTVVGNVTSYLGDTTGSTLVNFGFPSCTILVGTQDVPSALHRYTTSVRSTLTLASLDIDGALDDTVVWAYGDCQNPTEELACNDDNPAGGLYSLGTSVVVPANTTVYIVVSGYAAADVGPYSLQVTEVAVISAGNPCDPADPTQQCEPNAACEGPPGGETCQSAVCGDDIIEGLEECDDGNMMDGDGCSSTCAVEVFLETEPNDTSATANGPYTPDVGLIGAAIGVVGDQDYFAINVPATADLRIETFDTSGPSTCAGGIDTVIQLRAPDGTTVLVTDDQDGVNSCSLINSPTDAAARHIAPGVYYVRVEEFGNNATIAGYTLQVTFNALCGDAVVEGAEECEPGGATPCEATCDRTPVCGDTFLDAPEQCDDGNTANGDGCSSTCVVEQDDVEPNGTAAEALAIGAFDPGDVIAGTIYPGTDLDFFAITIPATADLRIETLDASGMATCTGFIDTVIQLRATDGTTILITKDQGGVANCSRIDSTLAVDAAARKLAPGTYYVRVEDYLQNTVIPAYTLHVTYNALCGDGMTQGSETCDDGNTASGDGCSSACLIELPAESEPNDSFMTADPAAAGGISASINVAQDDDYFAVTVPGPASVLTATLTAAGTNMCGTADIDSEIEIYGTDGVTSLVFNEDISASDYCSSAQASGLAAGTYYVRAASSEAYAPDDTFDYTLTITIN